MAENVLPLDKTIGKAQIGVLVQGMNCLPQVDVESKFSPMSEADEMTRLRIEFEQAKQNRNDKRPLLTAATVVRFL